MGNRREILVWYTRDPGREQLVRQHEGDKKKLKLAGIAERGSMWLK